MYRHRLKTKFLFALTVMSLLAALYLLITGGYYLSQYFNEGINLLKASIRIMPGLMFVISCLFFWKAMKINIVTEEVVITRIEVFKVDQVTAVDEVSVIESRLDQDE